MINKALSSLLERAAIAKFSLGEFLIGGALGIVAPILAWLMGGILSLLIGAQSANGLDPLAKWLPNPAGFLSQESPVLVRTTTLLLLAFAILAISAVLLFLFYRLVQQRSLTFEMRLMERLKQHAKRLARWRTLSAQQQALADGLDYHLPRVRSSLARWWRAFPRHAVQLIASAVVALLIEPLLGLLTIVSAGLIAVVYRFLDRGRRTFLPVVRERASLVRGELVGLSLKGPLLESVHEESEVERRFAECLQHYRRDAFRSLTSSSWRQPTMLFVSGALAGLFLFVVAVQVLGDASEFGLSGAFCFGLCVLAASVSAERLRRANRELRTIETAVDELERFLALPVPEIDPSGLVQIERITTGAKLEHVTVLDSRGRKLLENVSVDFEPGKLIGVVASQTLQAQALVELLLGFGRPVSGRMLIDGKVVTDLEPESLIRCAHWVAADGALETATVSDNLMGKRPSSSDALQDVIAASKLVDAVRKLPEGLATVITPNDDRLAQDTPFRMGIARAAVRRPSVVVMEEPKLGGIDAETAAETLQAMKAIVGGSVIAVVLPQRLATLRECDCVVMLHEHRVVDVGSHSELLQRNELYRHLNYLKFNPFGRS